MIHMTETLAVQTVEGFLTPEETADLTKLLDDHLASTGWVPARPSEGLVPPPAAHALLDHAFRRALPVLCRAFPSAVGVDPWLYHDLKPGNGIRPHVHGLGDPGASPQRIARVAFDLQDAEEGGEFYLDTCSADALWSDTPAPADGAYAPGTRFVHEITARTGPVRLADVPHTRWTCSPPPGALVVYGAQLVHGVRPVVAGRVRKLITNLLA
ncbi:hypothetical protein I5Q34_24390 [Streptomyces sp. AV19]|uniref:hypothetical protein n=1 Tax=Streptomyces sp. AV19 TaxID=2793068 RepID=UPI0018FE03E8|nr:hypothetical protein [Streptomyces sp. AV19]MBH1937368.1 hypothetical protein [Streptomyces sp. AV19]MDG4533902.1 hypothetical protein [Streptomyces sp. AV19]